MGDSSTYEGREQTLLKHRVLRKYLQAWAHKLGSVARGRPVRLWYVDCFAGPWESRDENIVDTSVAIGLETLNQVLGEWSATVGASLTASAIFVEARSGRSSVLEQHVERLAGGVSTYVLHGEFEDVTSEVERLIGDEAGFIFVDPTGWKGAGMANIVPLVQHRRRDVLINLMYDHINRFKGEKVRPWLRQQLADFFGLEDNAELAGATERGLVDIYRRKLKEHTGLRFVADLAVPEPTSERTYFHLILGCRHEAAIELFRDVEQSIIGREATAVREEARRVKAEKRTGQGEFSFEAPARMDSRYESLHEQGLQRAELAVLNAVRSGPVRYEVLWPSVLEDAHVTKSELGRMVVKLARSGQLHIEGLGPRQRVAKKEHVLRAPEQEMPTS